uniref:Ig-like domain-containing protein n=1 Tax=Haplochromis burtoni TaxID=8153 RepID=A0A3Q2W296_HAPBU
NNLLNLYVCVLLTPTRRGCRSYRLLCPMANVGQTTCCAGYQETITAESGQDVTLTCRAPNNNGDIVEWSRTDPRDTFVFVLKNKKHNGDVQDPSFKNRVALQDKDMKDGNVSVILYNVTAADNGTYECRIIEARTAGGKEARGMEDGSVGLKVGVTVGVIVVAVVGVCFLIYRKRKQHNQGSYEPPV